MVRLPPTSFVIALVIASIAFAAGPARAQTAPSFGERPSRDVALPQFTDADVARLVSTLDAILPVDTPSDQWRDAARLPLWEFVRRLQDGHLSADQEARVIQHLDDLERAHPAAAGIVDGARRAVTRLTVGKPAPDIVGVDLDGTPMKLSDHRGRVVVLKFGGSWCAICRSEYPYDRFLLNLYATWPFAMLGVDGSDSAELARESRTEHGLPYRAWWDGREGPDDRGPIAADWNVMGWPTTYVIDGEGIIRFVDLRAEDLLKAVRQLLVEQVRRTLKASEGGPEVIER